MRSHHDKRGILRAQRKRIRRERAKMRREGMCEPAWVITGFDNDTGSVKCAVIDPDGWGEREAACIVPHGRKCTLQEYREGVWAGREVA